MWRCPKCGSKNDDGWICQNCGHDDSKNYERRLLPFPLPEGKLKYNPKTRKPISAKTVVTAQAASPNPASQKSDEKKEKKKGRLKAFFVTVLSVLLIVAAMFSFLMGVLLLQESDLPGKVFGLCWLASGILLCFLVWLLVKWRKRKRKAVIETGPVK